MRCLDRQGAMGTQMEYCLQPQATSALAQRRRSLGWTAVVLMAASMPGVAQRCGPETGQKTPENVVCPLSDSQTQKSIEAFAKIAAAIGGEPRCLGCHGRVNPYIDGTGSDPANPGAPPSEFEHGPGKVDHGADCNECHSNMAKKTCDGKPSNWMTAPDFLAFVGRDAPTICKQIRDILHTGKDFLGHLKDDNGANNFAGTAFNGDRGLDRKMFPEKEVPTEKPHISKAAFMKLAQDWIDAMGGEFKGDKACGCEPEHFAIQFSSTTSIDIQSLHHESVMGPVKIPIDFKDDGSFDGSATSVFNAGGTVADCGEQSKLSVPFKVSGNAKETTKEQSMHIDMEYPFSMAMSISTECPDGGSSNLQTGLQAPNITLPIETTGKVGEQLAGAVQTGPGMVTSTDLQIVRTDEAGP